MEPELRSDPTFWIGIWAPLTSYAAWKRGEKEARAFLDEAISGGFGGSGEFEILLTEAFGADQDWSELVDAMRANVPAPSLEIVDWPTAHLSRPIRLFRLDDDREALLREWIPAPEDTAWGTALQLLGWVAGRWQHANAHVDEQDAVAIVKLVDKGERFACVEYSTVLSQALNASRIPARVVNLYAEGYHAGLGKGHVVSEAWIDGLDAWVVLDGQNGMYWSDDAGTPLGIPALQDRLTGGEGRALVAVVGPNPVTGDEAELWWRYFAHASPTGATWSETAFVPIFQNEGVRRADVLVRDRAEAYRDLAEIAIGITSVDGRPAVCPHTEHPFATGFQITVGETQQMTVELDGAWPVPTESAGDHVASIAAVMPYTTLAPARLALRFG
jgi:Transglutaminase-like superfamily